MSAPPPSDPSAPARLQAWVSGRVQGVNFRYYTRQQAGALGLKGWVRNLADGRVEVVAEGPRPVLERLETWLQHGPPSAAVTRLQVSWSAATHEFHSFEVLA